jgi:hypothetical protein
MARFRPLDAWRAGTVLPQQHKIVLVADDTGGTIWRIAYKDPSERAALPEARPRASGRLFAAP